MSSSSNIGIVGCEVRESGYSLFKESQGTGDELGLSRSRFEKRTREGGTLLPAVLRFRASIFDNVVGMKGIELKGKTAPDKKI